MEKLLVMPPEETLYVRGLWRWERWPWLGEEEWEAEAEVYTKTAAFFFFKLICGVRWLVEGKWPVVFDR